ncbi:MAG: rhomboid family intramembrane serine protease [Planctomycetaceae bacterium]|nr:rhomboid family intramembrane serine protease [Planctomycetaceae bacterium]
MRHIGTIPDSDQAARFQGFLIAQGTKCRLDDEADGVAVWVYDDDRVPAARQHLAEFLATPDDARFRDADKQAAAVLREEAAKRKAARRNTVVMSQRWSRPAGMQAPITVAILVACVYLFVETEFLKDQRGIMLRLFISDDGTWTAIRNGEVWRLFTPVLMHGGVLHILCNLLWWWDLGLMIENRRGSLRFLLMVIAIAVGSNVLQFEMDGPRFLGLSGVVFGLFGYVWVKGKLDPSDGLGISDQNAVWMLVWFVLCFTPFVGNIANWAHTGGLVLGVLFGALSALWRQTMSRR